MKEKQPCVYFHYDLKGECFYVGKSKDSTGRPFIKAKAVRSKLWWEAFTKLCNQDEKAMTVVIKKCESEGDALNLEWDSIRKLKPIANVQYNPDFEAIEEINPTQLLHIALPTGIVDVYHKTGYGNVTQLFSAGNTQRGLDGDSALSLTLVLRASKTREFMEILSSESRIPIDDLVRKEGKGKASITTAHLYLIVYLAERLSVRFHYHVIDTFIHSEILRSRDEGGNAFKALNIAVDAYLPNRESKSNKGIYIQCAKMLRAKIFDGIEWNTKTQGNIWNSDHATAERQKVRGIYEDRLISALKFGLINDWEHLKEVIGKL